jgi:hypothetical protein
MYILYTKRYITMFTNINHENELKSVFVHINSKAAYKKSVGSYTLQRNKTKRKDHHKKVTLPFQIQP